MNTFDFVFYIGEKRYDLYVDSSKNEWKRIVLNNKELFNEEYTIAFNTKAYVIYYPIAIGDDTLVVSINDNELVHDYNVYLNNVSLIDGTRLDQEYKESQKQVEMGFKAFVKSNLLEVARNNIAVLVAALAAFWAFWMQSSMHIAIKIALIALTDPLILAVLLVGEWVHCKNVVKKFKSCFRKKEQL